MVCAFAIWDKLCRAARVQVLAEIDELDFESAQLVQHFEEWRGDRPGPSWQFNKS